MAQSPQTWCYDVLMKYHLMHNCSILIISVTMQCYAMYAYVTEYMWSDKNTSKAEILEFMSFYLCMYLLLFLFRCKVAGHCVGLNDTNISIPPLPINPACCWLLLAAGGCWSPSSSPRLFPLYNMHKYNCLSYYADGGMIAAAEIVQFAIVSP